MGLVYLPIDIDVGDIDEKKILKWFHNHKLLDTDYWEYTENRHTWAMVSCCRDPGDWRRYPKILEHRCFAFNNRDCFHGASPTQREKIIITSAGIIDNQKHEELLSKSLNKFKEHALYLEDLE